MLNLNQKDFPMAKTLTYLNSASISLMPRPAIESMIRFQRKIASGGTIGFDEDAETRALEDARDQAAALLRAHRDEVAILSSATDGICSLAWALEIRRGSNVVSTDADFPSVVYPWMRLGEGRGIKVRLAKNQDGVVGTDEMERLVDDKTVVLSISHVEYGTGQRFDLRRLSELAHSHGSFLVVDATQSAGLVPIDVHRDGVDALVAGGYKGLLGPFGAAIFYVKRELAKRLVPPFAGWRSTRVPYNLDATRLTFAKDVKKFECSTLNYASPIGLNESMRYLRRLGHGNVTRHVLLLTGKMIEAVQADDRLRGTRVLTPTQQQSHASIASFRFKTRNQSDIAAELVRRKIIVSQRFNGVRFSFHVYNTVEDIAAALKVLDQMTNNRRLFKA